MQLVAQWGVLRDGDDRRFAGVAFLALDALFAFFSALALDALFAFFSALASGTNGPLRAGIALWADGTAVGPWIVTWLYGSDGQQPFPRQDLV